MCLSSMYLTPYEHSLPVKSPKRALHAHLQVLLPPKLGAAQYTAEACLIAFCQYFVCVVQLVWVHLPCESQQGDVHGGNITSGHLALLLCYFGGSSTELAECVCLAVCLQHGLICSSVTAMQTNPMFADMSQCCTPCSCSTDSSIVA